MAATIATPGVLRPAAFAVVNPSGQRHRVPVDSTPFLIGRQADNQIVLRDNRISRVHARVLIEGEDFFIEDMNSRHGVFVNGEQVNRHKLAAADRVSFGFQDSYHLVFTFEETDLNRLLDHLGEPAKAPGFGGGNLSKLHALVEVARALQNSLSTDEVLSSVVDAALTVTGSERGFLLLKESDKDDLEIRVARNRNGVGLRTSDLRVPTRLIKRALEQRRDLLSMHFDPNQEGADSPDVSVANLELSSVVCVPLVRIRSALSQQTMASSMHETVGVLYMDSRIGVADLSSGNRELLQTLALETSTILENARLLEQERAKHRMEEELTIARAIQQGLLPRQLPTTGWFRVAGSSVASLQVGGDYFDVARIDENSWSTVVADVCGKGVSSALLASLLQGAFLRGATTSEQITEMLARTNAFLNERTQGEKYATLFYCTLNSAGRLLWSNAGHCPPLVVHPDGSTDSLDPTGLPVGLFDFAEYEVKTTQLSPRDKVILYSDGFPEAQDIHGEFFELERMTAVITACAARSCQEIHTALMKEVARFTGGADQSDDITLVVMEFAPQ